MIVNPSCSDEIIGKAQHRRSLVSAQSARLCCAYLYADAGDGESTHDLVFAGHNLICENGVLLAESRLFQNEMAITEIDLDRLAFERRRMTSFPPAKDEEYQKISFSLRLSPTQLTRPVHPYPFIPSSADDRGNAARKSSPCRQPAWPAFGTCHAKSAVIGLSGGLDSTLALLVAVRAMKKLGRPAGDILAVTMPCFGTTRRTKSNAQRLAEAYGHLFSRGGHHRRDSPALL